MTSPPAVALPPSSRRNALAKLGALLLAAAGLLVTLYLVADTGFAEVGQAFAGAGWGLVLVVLCHVVALCFAGMAWRAVLRPLWQGRRRTFILIRLVREAINTLLPVAQIGGDVIGARMLAKRGPAASLAVAAVIADKTVETIGQLVFTIGGVLLLLARSSDGSLALGFGLGLLVAGPALLGFLALQNSRFFGGLERMLLALAARLQWGALGRMAGLHAHLVALYQQPSGFAKALSFHTLAWTAGAGEVWVALYVMGHPIDIADALILESLGQAARSAAFLIPGGLGAQEGAFLLVGGALGLPAEFALALSLIKRVSQLLFGIPALIAWPLIATGRRT
jgi:putative membrane protein